MPAPRLVRAADRFAVWHEAADDDAVVPPGYDPVAPEDIVAPDGGDLTPDGAITMGGPELDEPAVVIPNSNKFKTPANGLKKLLETKVWGADESPSLGMPEHSSPNVKDWIDKHPAFAKTYFKPSYQDALKASLGDANYKKLLYHMPKEHHQALTTHVQHPAPNSNKFKTPANGLSKLLHNPETTPEHVQAWVDKHPVFAKGYLHNPNYQDAIKSVIGEANYKAWAKDLKLPSLKKTLEQKTQDAADAFAPTGLVPKTQEQFFDDHVGDAGPVGPHHNQYTDPALLEKNQPKPVQEPIQGEMSPEDQADIDAIKAEQSGFSDAGPALDDALGPPAASPPELFADWQKVFPGATAAPDQEKMQAYLSAPAGEIDPDVKAKIQAIYDKHFGQPSVPPEDQPEVDAIKQQAVAQGIKAIFPNVDPSVATMPVDQQKKLLEDWATHLAHTPGHKDNLTALKKLYDQHFGQTPQPAPAAPPAAPTAPGQDEWEQQLLSQPLSPDDQAEADAIKSQMPAPAKPLSVGEQLKALIPDKPVTAEQLDAKLQGASHAEIKSLFDNTIKDNPDLAPQLKEIFNANFGPQTTPAGKKKLLLNDIKSALPPLHVKNNTGADWQHVLLGTDPASIQAQLKAVIDHGVDPTGQLQKIYRQHFGDTPLPPTSPPPGKLTPAIFKKYMGMGYEQWAKDGDPEAQKDAIKKMIASGKDEGHPAWAKWQAMYDEAFGPDTGPNDQAPQLEQGVISDDPTKNKDIVTDEYGKGYLSVKMYNQLLKNPGMLQTWMGMTHDQKAALGGDDYVAKQNAWVNEHKDDPYASPGGAPIAMAPAGGGDLLKPKNIEEMKELGHMLWPNISDETLQGWAEVNFDKVHSGDDEDTWNNPGNFGPQYWQQNYPEGWQQWVQKKKQGQPAGAAAPHIGPDGQLTPEFKAWFYQNNSEADLDDPFYKQQVDMLHDLSNPWTQQKIKSYQKSLVPDWATDKWIDYHSWYPAYKLFKDSLLPLEPNLSEESAIAAWDNLNPEIQAQYYTKANPGGGEAKPPVSGSPITMEQWDALVPNFKGWFGAKLQGKSADEQMAVLKNLVQVEPNTPLGPGAALILKKYWDYTDPDFDYNNMPLPDWLDISKDGYPDWVDADSTDDTNSYYSWLQSWEPHDLQYWALHPDQAQKSWQYHNSEGKWLTPEDFSKVEEGGPVTPRSIGPVPFKGGIDYAKEYAQATNWNVDPGDLTEINSGGIKYVEMTADQAKHDLEDDIKTGHGDPVKVKALYEKYFGKGVPSGVTQPAGAQWQPDAPTPPTFGQEFYDCSPDTLVPAENLQAMDYKQAKQVLDYWAHKSGVDPEKKQKFQALYEKYFGSGNTVLDSPQVKYDPAQAKDDWLAIWTSDQNTWENQGMDDPQKAKAYVEQLLEGTTDTGYKVPEMKAWLAKHFGPGTSGPAPFDPIAFSDEIHQIDPNQSDTYWSNSTSEEAKEQLADWIASDDDSVDHADLQKIYDKWFGSGAAQVSPDAYDPAAALAEWNTIFPNGNPTDFSSAVEAEKKVHEWWQQANAVGIPSPQLEEKKAKVKAFYDKWFGKGVYDGPAGSGTPAGGTPTAPTPGIYFKPTVNELKALFPGDEAFAQDIADFSDAEFKENYDFVKGQMAAGAWTNPDTPWTKIVKYIDSKAPSDTPAFAPPPPPLPPFDPAAFQVAYKAMFPGSGWDATQHTPEQTKAKMQEMVQTKIKNFGYNPTTQTQIDLYEKWFGPFTPSSTTTPPGPPPPPPPAPMTPDQAYAKLAADPENAKLFGSPEFKAWFMQNPAKQIAWATNPDLAAVAYEEATLPPPPPPMPFKSQPFKPDELAHWAANKPISEAGWKNFSTWWANTQVPPEQEQALYKAWFDKDTSPEQAGAWFQAMFELHAKPSAGDLGLQSGLLPNWAQSTWAFGPNAAKEWPVFQAWATKEPGLPKNANIKQKLMIWNSLSPEDKQAIAENYFPANPVDTKAVIADLAKAYPDSDWKPWLGMGQGTLKSNLAMLAETGAYPGAIAAYNKYFGGNIPMPEPVKPGQKPKKPKTIPSLPVSKMPKWTQSYGQFTQDEDGARKYTHFLRFAESIGRGPEAKGEVPDKEGYSGRPYSLMMMWNAVPPHLKAQLALMPTLPWKDEDGFKAWVAAQPTLKDEVQAIDPVAYQGQSWYTNPLNNKITLESLLDSQTDPHKKQALLDVYQKYFGAENKPTLAEVLKATDPSTDWDKYLKTTPVDTVAKLLKKKIKDEKDPDKFIRYCDIWSKFFTGPPGNKALSSVLGKGHTGGKPLSASDLQKLWNWKAQGDPTAPVGVYGWQEAASPYIEQQQKEWSNQGYYPRYYGWTPPWEPGSATPYVPDPALLGSSPTATYELPQLTKSQDYQDLLQSVNTFVPWLLSPHDKNVLKSDQFQNWFENASPAYKAQYKDHPGTAVSDFEKFIDQGGTTYGPVVGDPAVNPKVYDLSPFNMIPKPSDKDIGGHKFKQEFTHNKPRWDQVKFPRKLDPQETLPLQPGDRWAPDYAAMPIYRLIPNDVLDLDATPRLSSRYDNLPPRQKEYQLELQRWRLRKIDQIINGPNAKRDFASDKKYFDNWCSSHDITPDQKKDIENTIFAVQPILSDDQKWKYFEDWAAKNNVEPSAMYDLASKVGVGNPGEGVPNQQGNYDSPELAQLILDYLENGRGGDTMGGGLGGLGVHWTRAKDLLYHPKDSGMGGANAMKPGGAGTNVGGRRIPIYLWALWPGAGESSGGGGAYSADTDSELEHMLQQGAKVFLRRLQIRDEKGDFHDLIDPGPISTWARGRDESSSGRNSQDKESLAARLDYDLPDVKHDPEEWDYLAPGPEADAKFAKLFEQYGLLSPGVGLKGEHPEYMKSKDPDHPHPEWQEELSPQQQKIKQKLLKAYEHFFVGKPHLPPAHFRFASQSTHRVAAAEQLFDMATVWGVRDAEKYGMPMHLARALRPQPKPRVVAYDAPRGGIEVRKRPGIVTVHERYL